jgi:hypothetical protein
MIRHMTTRRLSQEINAFLGKNYSAIFTAQYVESPEEKSPICSGVEREGALWEGVILIDPFSKIIAERSLTVAAIGPMAEEVKRPECSRTDEALPSLRECFARPFRSRGSLRRRADAGYQGKRSAMLL